MDIKIFAIAALSTIIIALAVFLFLFLQGCKETDFTKNIDSIDGVYKSIDNNFNTTIIIKNDTLHYKSDYEDMLVKISKKKENVAFLDNAFRIDFDENEEKTPSYSMIFSKEEINQNEVLILSLTDFEHDGRGEIVFNEFVKENIDISSDFCSKIYQKLNSKKAIPTYVMLKTLECENILESLKWHRKSLDALKIMLLDEEKEAILHIEIEGKLKSKKIVIQAKIINDDILSIKDFVVSDENADFDSILDECKNTFGNALVQDKNTKKSVLFTIDERYNLLIEHEKETNYTSFYIENR